MNQGKIVLETAADTNNRQREGAGWASGPMMGRGSRAIFDLRYEDTDPAAACSPKTMYNLIGHSSYPIPTAVYMERCLRIFFSRTPRFLPLPSNPASAGHPAETGCRPATLDPRGPAYYCEALSPSTRCILTRADSCSNTIHSHLTSLCGVAVAPQCYHLWSTP